MMKKRLASILVAILTLCFLITPVYADDELITYNVNIYTNGELVATDVKQETGEWDFPIGYYYGDLYGEYSTATASMNGNSCMCFCFDGENVTVLDLSTFSSPTFGDVITLNVYYTKEVETEPEPEPVFGDVTLKLFNPDNVEYEDVVFNGVKGADKQSFTAPFVDNILSTSLDVSYNWTYTFDGLTYNITEFPWTADLILHKPDEPEPEPLENTEYIDVTYYFSYAPGGIEVDGEPLSAIKSFGPYTILAENLYSCTELGLVQDGNMAIYNGDIYVVGTVYHQKNTPNDIYTVNYTLQVPHCTVIVNYLDDQGNEIFMHTHRDFEVSTAARGEKTYDVSDCAEFKIKGYEYKETTGDALQGEANGDKIINIIYTLKETEDSEPNNSEPENSEPNNSEPNDSDPDDSKPDDSKPEDSKPDDSKPNDSEPNNEDSKPDDSKPKDEDDSSDSKNNDDSSEPEKDESSKPNSEESSNPNDEDSKPNDEESSTPNKEESSTPTEESSKPNTSESSQPNNEESSTKTEESSKPTDNPPPAASTSTTPEESSQPEESSEPVIEESSVVIEESSKIEESSIVEESSEIPTRTVGPIEEIIDEEVPLATTGTAAWAVINLILLVLTIFTLQKFRDGDKYNILNYILPVVALGLFIWTENVHNPWTWVDKWTIVQFLAYIAAIIFRLPIFHKKEEEPEETNE